jgi:hypothetical protein
MNRRHFVTSSTAASIGCYLFRSSLYDVALSQTRIAGDFEFSWQGGKLKLKAKDVLIDGLTIPKFTWAWIGLGVAQGVLSAFGGAVFSALASAILGGGKSIEQLLKEQLTEFARIVEEQLQENDLRNYQARIVAFVSLFQEYRNSPTVSRLDYLVNNSAEALSQIESLGFKGYRTYMSAAGLRLTVLQEVSRRNRTIGNQQNFREQRQRSVDVHNSVLSTIEAQTDLQTHATRVIEENPLARGVMQGYDAAIRQGMFAVTRPILGVKPSELPLAPPHIAVPIAVTEINRNAPPQAAFVDWQALRARLKSQNTDIGAKIVDRWNRA